MTNSGVSTIEGLHYMMSKMEIVKDQKTSTIVRSSILEERPLPMISLYTDFNKRYDWGSLT